MQTLRNHSDLSVEFKDVLTEKQNVGAGILTRSSANGSMANLLRKLPGISPLMKRFSIALNLVPKASIRKAAQSVIADLRRITRTGKIAVVHVRRGDKITVDKKGRCSYCCHTMMKATDPHNIAKVLRRNQIAAGSAVYIMTNEANWTHFAPLWHDYHYEVRGWAQYAEAAALMAGCDSPEEEGVCENFSLFVLEEDVLNSVPRDRRITTLAPSTHQLTPVGGVADSLMNDFRGECSWHDSTVTAAPGTKRSRDLQVGLTQCYM